MGRHGAVAVVVVVLLVGCTGGSSTGARPSARAHAPATTTVTTTPLPLDGPAALAATLTTIERGLRAPGDPDAARLGLVQVRAYGTLVSHPEWRAGVLAAVPADVQPAVSANLDASVSLDSLTTAGPKAATFPPWTVRAPLPEPTLLADYHEAEQATGVPWGYLAGIHLIESRLGRIMGPSSAGAQGPMQFEPATWAEYGRGTNIDDDHDAILAAGRLLAARGGPANIGRALLAYNNDSRYVRAVEDYETVLAANAAAFDGYYQWPVVYETSAGTYVLPVGYPQQPAVRQAG
ncbi:MAG TPA: lytic transglycosylase domain-containing protein [Acidimicrobiia bacterium]|nr:lytic transglycosylase domain-containing protein [Acidimicrobiia bacterium]